MATGTIAETRVQKWGNSQGVRIPKEACEASGLAVGDTVRITCEEGVVTLTAVRERPKYRRTGYRTLEEICAGYDGPKVGEEWLVGRVGAEVIE